MYPVAALAGNWVVLGVVISPAQLLGLLLVLATLVVLAWTSASTTNSDPPPATTLDTRPIPSATHIQPRWHVSGPTPASCPMQRRFCSRSAAG
jgi:hypothetical protein